MKNESNNPFERQSRAEAKMFEVYDLLNKAKSNLKQIEEKLLEYEEIGGLK